VLAVVPHPVSKFPTGAWVGAVNVSLFVPLLVAHLLAVNLAAAGPLASLLLEWLAARRGSAVGDEVARKLARHVLGAFALGIVLGSVFLALLWRRDGDPFVAAVQQFSPAKLWFAGGELVFFALCHAIYLWMWSRPWRRTTSGRITHRVLAVLAATNLLYHFPPMMVVIAEIAAGQIAASGVIDAAAYRELVYTPAVAARSMHHIMAAVALAGLYAAALAWGRRNAGKASETEFADATRAGSWAGCLALAAALLQVPVGIWVLVNMPNNRVLMGDDLLATGMFIAAVIAALGLMQHLAAIAFGDLTRKNVVTALALYVMVIVLMTTTRVLSRSAAERNRAAAVEVESTLEQTLRFS
jgi:hypothetical protein